MQVCLYLSLSLWADSGKYLSVSAHCGYLSHCTWQVNWLWMKERGSGGNTPRHLRQMAQCYICLTHTQKSWSTMHLLCNQAINAIPKSTTVPQLKKLLIAGKAANEWNLLELLVATAEQMAVSSLFASVKWAELSWAKCKWKIETESCTRRSSKVL